MNSSEALSASVLSIVMKWTIMDFLPSFKQSLFLFLGVGLAMTVNAIWGDSLELSATYQFVIVFISGLVLGIVLLTIYTFVTAFQEA